MPPARTDALTPMVVTAPDGVRLHTELRGAPDAPVTVVLSHGYLVNRDSWWHQLPPLARNARVVTWDHRGHGRSTRGALSELTIDQLGRDLLAVLEQTTPEGPVVLVGHSMGGMAILALAEQHPELFGTRVTGTALLTTAASPIQLGPKLPPQAASSLVEAGQRAVSLARRLPLPLAAKPVTDVARWLIASCASGSLRPSVVDSWLASMVAATPLEVVLALVPQFLALDKTAGLPILGRTDALVLGAADDTVTAPEHSAAIAAAIPGARLVMLDDGGHNAHVDHPHQVNPHLHDLVARVTARMTPPAWAGAPCAGAEAS